MSARSFIKGPRFALKNPATMTACERCVYGTGEHAQWCTLSSIAGREANADLSLGATDKRPTAGRTTSGSKTEAA